MDFGPYVRLVAGVVYISLAPVRNLFRGSHNALRLFPSDTRWAGEAASSTEILKASARTGLSDLQVRTYTHRTLTC